jgi:hypothetical protein
MKSRCFVESNSSFKNYGGRGIGVCDEWLDFETFRDWAMSSGYNDELTIERIDVNGDYEPVNCKWISKSEQSRNRRITRFIEIDGVTKSIQEWCDEYETNYSLVHQRISKLGWEPKKALTTPPRVIKRTRIRKQVKHG